ncbi:hypothetical protein BDA96_06G088000 [Sorghum bicolor]|uniref:Uncharacterized protein n=2 Tax=Sorghum bicolor TaxID=4558 RepID=A0A921QRV5_SORBI|nr:hypothetical protein BDA96_06G088000 [Sorghum bicolor]OQU81584.1 hypothetical protein SORBI_3006G080050 [Sorghum bicolor]
MLHFHKVESAKFQLHRRFPQQLYELIIDASTNRFGAGDNKYRAMVEVLAMVVPQKVISFEAIRLPHTN